MSDFLSWAESNATVSHTEDFHYDGAKYKATYKNIKGTMPKGKIRALKEKYFTFTIVIKRLIICIIL